MISGLGEQKAFIGRGGMLAFAAVSAKDGYAHKADIKNLASCPKALIASRARAKHIETQSTFTGLQILIAGLGGYTVNVSWSLKRSYPPNNQEFTSVTILFRESS